MVAVVDDGKSVIPKEVQAITALVFGAAMLDGLMMPPVAEAISEMAQTVGFTAAKALDTGLDLFSGAQMPRLVRQGNIIGHVAE